MTEHTFTHPQKARSACRKSLSGMDGKALPSHKRVYYTDSQTHARNAQKPRICVRTPHPTAVERSRGVEELCEREFMQYPIAL